MEKSGNLQRLDRWYMNTFFGQVFEKTGAALVVGGVAASVILGKTVHIEADTPHAGDPHSPAYASPALAVSPDITVDSRLTVRQADRLIGCHLQENTDPATWPDRHAKPGQIRCAQKLAATIAKTSYGWGPKQMNALNGLWTHESDWSANAKNPSSSAYGIPQSLMSYGNRTEEIEQEFGRGKYAYNHNIVSQIEWGLEYIHHATGNFHTPIQANRYWYSNCDGANGCYY